MLKVNNRQVVRRLAFRELLAHRKLNFVVILSIILSCVLFTALTSVGGSLINGAQQETMRQVGGDRMAGLKCVLPEDYEKVKADKATRAVVYRIVVGQAVGDSIKNISVEVNCAGNEDAAAALFCKPTTGRLPGRFNEIAASTLVLDELGLPHELGTSVPITLDVDGKISEHTFVLCGYWQGEKIAMAQECWVSREFADKYVPLPAESFYTQKFPAYGGYYMVDFNFANSWNIEGKTRALMERLYGDSAAPPDTGINWAYTTSTIDGGMLAGGIVMIFVIFAAGYLIIYNIFHINISANIRSYGLLKTIGMTARQIRKMVRMQAAVYCAFGIPFGLIAGTLLGDVLLKSIMGSLNIYSTASYTVDAKLLAAICLISAVFTFATVMISCRKPCKIAGNVSPIEALRYNEMDIPGGKANKKVTKKTGRVTPLSVAFSNMARKRKKTAVVVLSLSLSMVLVNTLFTALGGIDMDKFIGNLIVGDFLVKGTDTSGSVSNNFSSITPKDIESLGQIDGVEELNATYFSYASVNLSGKPLEKAQALYEKYADVEKWENADAEAVAEASSYDYDEYLSLKDLADGTLVSDLYGISAEIFSYLTVYDGNLDREKFLSGKYALIFTKYIDIDDDKNTDDDFFSPGDTVTISARGHTRDFEVMAVCDLPYPLCTQRYSTVYGHVLIPDHTFLNLTGKKKAMNVMLNVKDGYFERVNEQIQNQISRNSSGIIVKSRQDYLEEYNGFLNMIKLVGGTLSGILALIGILNFINAVAMGILSRKRELAMMSAVGMSGRQLSAMLMWEGVHYAVLTTVCSTVIGFLLSYNIIKPLASEMFFFTYHFTLLPIFLCVPVLLLLSAVIPMVSYRTICRESIVERLRENG